MKLPSVNEPHRYRGLYVYDFGEWAALGYTAEEIAILLESPEHGGGKIYKIVRATPDGQMELRGVAPERFQTESGLFFNRSELDDAATDFEDLARHADAAAPPCRAFLHLADRGGESVYRYVTALIYPAEYEDDMARWLLDADYHGGDVAEGGPSHVSNYHASDHNILRRQQLWSGSTIQARPANEVLASVRRAVQR